jgi:hypothetical protein
VSPENEEKSSPDKEPILAFKFPEKKEVEGYLVRLEDGTYVIRTKEELERSKKT